MRVPGYRYEGLPGVMRDDADEQDSEGLKSLSIDLDREVRTHGRGHVTGEG